MISRAFSRFHVSSGPSCSRAGWIRPAILPARAEQLWGFRAACWTMPPRRRRSPVVVLFQHSSWPSARLLSRCSIWARRSCPRSERRSVPRSTLGPSRRRARVRASMARPRPRPGRALLRALPRSPRRSALQDVACSSGPLGSSRDPRVASPLRRPARCIPILEARVLAWTSRARRRRLLRRLSVPRARSGLPRPVPSSRTRSPSRPRSLR